MGLAEDPDRKDAAKTAPDGDKILRNLKKQMRAADVSGGYYIGWIPWCQPDQLTILAVWVLLKFIDYVDPWSIIRQPTLPRFSS